MSDTFKMMVEMLHANGDNNPKNLVFTHALGYLKALMEVLDVLEK